MQKGAQSCVFLIMAKMGTNVLKKEDIFCFLRMATIIFFLNI